mmetsp:Transcript_149016/g.415269  ORF Transcript_149016/g.415269 Transcript_149016/m.415269 type:complete len:115 (-) Transcript_149016:91-435(-)
MAAAVATAGTWAAPPTGTSRVLVALGETLRSLVGEGLLSSEVADKVWLAAHNSFRRQAQGSVEMTELSGRINCYRACRGEWTIVLGGAKAAWSDGSHGDSQFGPLRLVCTESSS